MAQDRGELRQATVTETRLRQEDQRKVRPAAASFCFQGQPTIGGC